MYAAEQAAAPDAAALERTIAAQRISDGRPAPAGATAEHQAQPFTPAQMISLAAQYQQEMKAAVDRVETLRMQAYKSRDLIKMTFLDDKLTQISVVVKMAEPSGQALAHETESLTMRAHFSLVQQARDRAKEILADAEAAAGEDMGTVSTGNIQAEETQQNSGANDPTRPGTAIQDVTSLDRPGEASPYR